MSFAFDQTEDIGLVYFYDDSAGTYTERNKTTGDYFADDATVGDCLYFGKGYGGAISGVSSTPFHDLTVYIGTSLVADSITVVWEYDKEGTWTVISGVADNTNAFQNSGSQTVSFPIQEGHSGSASSFYRSNFPVSGKNCVWIRCRITAVTNISEGGANSTNAISVKDNCITVTSESPLSMEDIYDADVLDGWGVVSKLGDSQYLCEARLYLDNCDFQSYREQITFGQDNYEVSIGGNSACTWVFGYKNSEGFGYGGSDITLYSKGLYNSGFWADISFFGSRVWKSGGSWQTPQFYNSCDIRDSTLAGDYYYWPSSVDTQSYMYRTNYDCSYYFYCYTGSVSIDSIYLPYATVSCDGILLGSGEARIDNTTLISSSQKIRRKYECNVTLVNCYFGNTDWTNESGAFSCNNSPSGTQDLHIYVKYTLDLTVVDEEGNPIEGARVKLIDGQGNTILEPELSGLEFNSTIYSNIFGALYDWAEPPSYDAGMIGGTFTMTSGTNSGQKTTVVSGYASSWSGTNYSYFSLVDAIGEIGETFSFQKINNITDSNGQIETQECTVWDAYIDYSDSWSRQNIDYRQYKLIIEKNGYERYEQDWSFTEQADLRITLKRKHNLNQHSTVR